MTIFAKKFYGFNPEILPLVTFNGKSGRDNLIRVSKPGDLLLYVATKGDEVLEEEQGKILGLVEFGISTVPLKDTGIDINSLPKNYLDGKNEYKWTECLAMVRAWRFDPLLDRGDIFAPERLGGRNGSRTVIELDENETNKILNCNRVEVSLPETSWIKKERDKNDELSGKLNRSVNGHVERMVKTILDTVKNSNGQKVEITRKNKGCDLSKEELTEVLTRKLKEQNNKCNLTGHELSFNATGKDDWLVPSADRINSDGHYTEGNIQVVSKAVNRAKGAIEEGERLDSYFKALQFKD